MGLFESREDFSSITTDDPAPIQYGKPAGENMHLADQEKYFDNLDDWKPEDPDKEGPHFQEWQRDLIEKGPEPDPDDGIHMSEDEFIGHEPDQRQWGYRYKTELPEEWDRPMGLGAPGSATDGQGEPPVPTPQETPEEAPEGFTERSMFESKGLRSRPTLEQDQAEIEEARKLYDEGVAEPEEGPGFWGTVKDATEKAQQGFDGEFDPVKIARYAGRTSFVLGAVRAYENIGHYLTQTDYWKDAPEGWNRDDHYDFKEIQDLPSEIQQSFFGARNPAQMEEAKERAALFRRDQRNLKAASPVAAGLMYTGRFVAESISSRGAGIPASAFFRATGAFRRIDQTSKMAQTIIRNTPDKATGFAALGAARGAQQGIVGGLAESALTISTGSMPAMEAFMTPITGTLGSTAGGFADPKGMLRYTKFGGGWRDRQIKAGFRRFMDEYRASGAREVQALRKAGKIKDPAVFKQESRDVDVDEWQKPPKEEDYRPPVKPDEDVEAPAPPNKAPEQSPEAMPNANRETDFEGTAPGRDTDEEELLASLADHADDGPAPNRQIIIEDDIVKGVREQGKARDASRMIDEDTETLHDIFRKTDPSMEGDLSKTAKKAGEAFDRQGIRVERTQKVYMPNGKSHHKFAKDSGFNLRHAYKSADEAARWSEPDVEIVEVTLPAGSKHLPGRLLGDDVGNDGDILLGMGRAVKKADGTYEWRTRKDIRGENQIIRAELPEGGRVRKEILEEQNDGYDRGIVKWEHPEHHSPSSVGAAQVISPQQGMKSSNYVTSETVKDALNKPDGGLTRLVGLQYAGKDYDKNVGLTLAGEVQGGRLNLAKNAAPDLTGNTLIQDRVDLESGNWGQGGAELKQTLNRVADTRLVDAEQEGFTMYLKELLANGQTMDSINTLGARLKYNEEITDFLLHQYWRKGVIPKELDKPSIRKYVEAYNATKKETVGFMNEPHKAAGATEKFEPAGGRIHTAHEDGAAPIRVHDKTVYDWENPKGSDGKVNQAMRVEGAVKENFQSQIQYNINRAKGGNVIARKDTGKLAEIMSDIQLTKKMTDWQEVTRGVRTINQFVSRLRSQGVDHDLVNAFRKQVREITNTADISEADFITKVMRFDPLKEVNVPLANGQGTRPFRLRDGMVTNALVSHRTEVRRLNAVISGATIPRRNADGVPMTKWIPDYDPKTGEVLKDANGKPIQKQVRWTLNTPEEVDKFKKDVRAENAARGNMDDGQVKAFEELLDSHFENSKEAPWQLVENFSNFATGMKLANSGFSAASDYFMNVRHGARALAEMPGTLNFVRTIQSQFDYFFKGQKTAYRGDALMEILQEEAAGATAQNRVFGGSPFQWANSEFAMNNSGGMNVIDAMAKRTSQNVEEVGLLWGGILKVQDAAQAVGMKAEWHNLADDAFKYKTVADFIKKSDGRVLTEWRRKGFRDKDLERAFKFMQSGAVKWRKTFAGGRYFDGIDKSHPDFDRDTLKMVSSVLTNSIARETVLENTPGSRIRGLDQGGWPAVMQFSGFPIASGSQLLRNNIRRALEGAHDIFNGQGQRGATTLAILAGVMATQAWTSAAIEVGKMEYNMIGWDEKRKKKFRDAYMKDPMWWINTMIDKSPVTGSIPWLYDNLWAPAINAPSFAGYSDWANKRTGAAGIIENAIFGNPAMSTFESISKVPQKMVSVGTGDADVKDYRDLNPMGSLFLYGKLVELMLLTMGVPPGDPRKFKELEKKNFVVESKNALKKLKYLKKMEGKK